MLDMINLELMILLLQFHKSWGCITDMCLQRSGLLRFFGLNSAEGILASVGK